MMTQEHCVSVDDGKFTFVAPAESNRVHILHHGEPWHELVLPCDYPIHALMSELDAARLVLAETRRVLTTSSAGLGPTARLRRAVERHDRLVSDHIEPSSWARDPAR